MIAGQDKRRIVRVKNLAELESVLKSQLKKVVREEIERDRKLALQAFESQRSVINDFVKLNFKPTSWDFGILTNIKAINAVRPLERV